MTSKTSRLITIGTFDGVHAGHRFLLSQLELRAAQHRLKPLALYFPLPPKTLLSLRPEMTVLTLPKEKRSLLRAAGTPVQALDFTACRHLTAEKFFTVLRRQFNMGGLLVGTDFAFGKNRQADTEWLRQQCKRHHLIFETVRFYKTGTQKVSSSLIRKTLAAGDIEQANLLLDRPYDLTGKVVKGKQLGRKLGFPTANLDTGIYKILPLGVFVVKVRVGRQFYNGFCNIGFRPTVNPIHDKLPLVEVHIFGFDKNIYGRNLQIWFVQKLREETKFNTLEELTGQLKKDRLEAKKLLRKFQLKK
ncbi:MAG: riboflavin biosynthesis protein RibF [Elusimicrobiaceae bacterium]|nr:riboflavin biosynthesis protein RibF [Elusimicrobiaceae bacterium]